MSGPQVQPILDSAERAASSGDYAQAESLLREVARLQAESLGPKHPDLASTFNNLGVVCERTNRLMDAGRFYREALSIASGSLESEHPLVVTSRNNFDEFHRGLGLVETKPDHDRDIVTTIPTSSELPRHAIVAGIAVAIALVGAVAIWFTRAPAPQPMAEKTSTVEQRLSEFGDPLVPVTPSAPAQESHPSPPPSTETIVVRPAPAAKATPASLTISAPQEADAEVLEASLCQTLSTAGGRWECTPTSGLAAGDSLYFYTRIVSPTSVRIHHRWYRNGTLRQDVGLLVHPNPSAGYRTYSQRRLETGDWRVVVVGADGAVLREESVEVR